MSHTMTIDDLSSGEIPSLLASFVRRAIPGWMRPESEDLAQQALVRVTGAFHRDPARTLNKSYLRQVARSVVVDFARRQRSRPVSNDASLIDRAPACRTTDPELATTNAQLLAQIEHALGAMLPSRATAVRLYLAGASIPEIGKTMSIGTKAAENLTYRGLKDLRADLVDRGLAPSM